MIIDTTRYITKLEMEKEKEKKRKETKKKPAHIRFLVLFFSIYKLKKIGGFFVLGRWKRAAGRWVGLGYGLGGEFLFVSRDSMLKQACEYPFPK